MPPASILEVAGEVFVILALKFGQLPEHAPISNLALGIGLWRGAVDQDRLLKVLVVLLFPPGVSGYSVITAPSSWGQ